MWTNWKEYFFYALSKSYNPENTGFDCTVGCIQLSGDNAGIVFFSGEKITDPVSLYVQQRFSPPLDAGLAADAVDDKDEVKNYLENNNAADFPNLTGSAVYEKAGAMSNDIMYCIKTDIDMSVSECL